MRLNYQAAHLHEFAQKGFVTEEIKTLDFWWDLRYEERRLVKLSLFLLDRKI